MADEMRALYVLQHTQSEFLGPIEDHLEGRGIRFQYVRPFAGAKVPGTAAHSDGLILLGGGPWGTASEPLLPTLQDELRLAREFLKRGRPVIGFGLGAQILALAAGGGAEPAPLVFAVGSARRVAADALGGHLPERYPLAVFMRDRPLPPAGAQILAVDDAERPALFQIGDKCFGFAGHPGLKPAIAEDLIMEFDDGPPEPARALEALRAAQTEMLDALSAIMVGLIQATGLMRPYDEQELARRRMIPIRRG
jgi:GMP synthase-like glutamine amidotransferase